ncbi:SusC/RagA family TonB-linked outer membrane protein [Flavicella sediminum]|uniref:SusC/RagA family TonB-linked outer membrane protein n=1 Tax=Flavicella sediminum TaxID=2585141 RepID=UPI001FB85632|nr:TonB-dependent receptor [Flavicella sediminum]
MKKIILLIILISCSFSGFSQISVNGKVTDSSGEPLPGVTILIKGLAKGTTSDFDGLYSFPKIKNNAVLIFSYLGYETQEVYVEGKTNIDLVMSQSSVGLEEVVVVGYGTVKKKDLTGSVATINADDLAKTATTNFDQAIAGRVTGVQVSSVDGTPGESLKIVIRGGNSITGDNSPLYVVDGIPLEDFDPASISTSDIESFDILKDASATAIYGSRAANGVIIITTKQGRSDGKTDVKVSSAYSMQWIPNRLEVLSPYEYVKYQQNIATALDNYTPGDYTRFFKKQWVDAELYKNSEGTSWQDAIFRLASTTRHTASLSGGNKTSTLYFSTEYLDQEGTLLNTGFKKVLNNLKFSHRLSSKTNFNGYMQYSHLKKSGINISGNKYTSIIRDALQFRPVEPIIDDGLEPGGYDPDEINQRYLFNPVKSLENTDRQSISDVIRGSVSMTHKFKPNLYFKTSGTYQVDTRKESVFYGQETQQGTRGTDHINGTLTMRRYQTLSTSNTLTYKKKFGKNNLTFLGGFEAQKRDYEYARMKNSEIPTDIFGIAKLGFGTSPSIPETLISGNTLASFFARANYAFKNKYLLTATYRADGSSKFKPENRWGYFPSFSGAWKISDEDFMMDIDAISFAKLRIGWGKTGNNRVGDYDAFSQLNASTSSGYVWGVGQNYIPGAYQSNLGVPDLRWETTAQTNVGLDLALFNQKIEVTADYYKKNTSDLLLKAEMALHTGFDKVQQNIGKVENEGFELTINSTNIQKDRFKWTTAFNISFNKNTTIALNDGQDAIYTDPEWSGSYPEYQYITKVGEPVGMMYGLQFDGIYQWDDFYWDNGLQAYQLNEGIPDNGTLPVGPGSVKFIDQDNNGTINSDDRVVIGNPHPKHFGGLNNSFQIGNIDLQFLLQWSYGFDILNTNNAVFGVPSAQRSNGFASLANAWSPTNTDTDVSTVRYLSIYGAPPKGNQIDNRSVEDGSYLKFKSFTVGYTVPSNISEKLNIQRLRFHFTGNNLFTWTKYSGYDPDVSVGKFGALTPNLDYSAYPQSTTLMTGVEITF